MGSETTLVKITFANGEIQVELERRPNAGQARALRWLADDGVLALNAVSATLVRFPLNAWQAAGELPSTTASEEETDEWQHRHDELARLLGSRGHRVHVDVQGFIGGPDCTFSLVVDGSPIPAAHASPVTDNGILLPVVFKAQAELASSPATWSREEQIAALARLRMHLSDAERLLDGSAAPLAVTWHPHIADIEVRSVTRAALAWRPSRRGQLLSLEMDEIHADDTRTRLPVENVSPRAPLISVSAKEHLLLPDEIAAVARIAKANRNQLERNVEPDPTRLLPPGFTYDSIDLSGYSERVLGFGPLEASDSPQALASGVEWYRKDADALIPTIRLRLHDATGSAVERDVATAEVEPLLEQARQAAGVSNTLKIQGEHYPITPALLNELERAADDVAAQGPSRATSSSSEPKPGSRGLEAAIIREASGAGTHALALDENPVPWNRLEGALAEAIKLREHQRAGIEWLWRHYKAQRTGVLLADEMGLGKTLQIGSFLALQALCGQPEDRLRSSLVVCPKILLPNWIDEMARYFVPGAIPRTREFPTELLRRGDGDLLEGGPASIFVISYETFARYQRELLRRQWATAVLDESQNIKNPDTYRTRAARGLKRSFGICATGTPVENRLRDLWSQFDFLSPGVPFGAAREFCSTYERDPDGAVLLRTRLRYPSRSSPLLRREKREALQGLPAAEETVHRIAMTPEQVASEERIVSGERDVLKIIAGLQKLYQHPALLGNGDALAMSPQEALAASPKLRACIALLRDVQKAGEKALIFTLWTQMQELLRSVIHHELGLFPVNVVNGASNQSGQSQKILKEFSAREGFSTLIMSPLAAGAGLNVTAANHVIHYGRWWNPAKEDQATARAHRMGQTRTVQVHYLVLHHPGNPQEGFDTKLHEYVVQKRAMATDFLMPAEDDGVGDVVKSLKGSVNK